jgi:long-chain acyl-CoA synthetase
MGHLFVASWARLLRSRSDDSAVLNPDHRTLRRFGEIETERQTWVEKLRRLEPGSVVVAQLANHPTWPALFLAILDLRLVLVPIEPEAAPISFAATLEMLRAAAIVTETGVNFRTSPSVAWGDSQPCLLKLTSGTSGTPRAVRVREEHLHADCRNICVSMDIRPDDVNFGVIPFAHSYGFSNLITPLIYQGTSLIASSDRMPRAIKRELQQSGATVFPGTPAIFQALAALPGTDSLRRVRTCITAGAALPPETARLFHSRYGLPIHNFYGSSECGGIAYDRNPHPSAPAGFVGSPMDGVQIDLLADQRIRVRGSNVADGYYPVDEPDKLGPHGFLPDDLVRSEPAGLVLFGRITDVLNVAGRKVHPSTIEDHLRQLAGVTDSIVFGIPSPTRNQDLVALVQAAPELSVAEIEAHCRSGLPAWQVPREFRLVDQMPVNARGKVSRAELAKIFITQGAIPGSEQNR